MFKAARWRSEKNKTKVGFRLQFHATEVPQVGWETMVVSLVPMDVGKPTARSGKAVVIDGTCHWMNAVKETVKLVRDQKTGKTNDKIYRFLVSATRSTKCGFLGEISINLTDYVEMLKPAIVSLPLKSPNSGVILHVTIQRMQADVEWREEDENRETNIRKQRKTTSGFTNRDEEEDDQVIMTNLYAREEDLFIKNYEQRKLISPQYKSNGNLRKSSSTDYTSASGSDSSSGQYTPEKTGTNNTKTRGDSSNFLSPIKNKGIPRKEINGLIDLVNDCRDNWTQKPSTEYVNALPIESMDLSTINTFKTGLREKLQEQNTSLGEHGSDDVALVRQIEVFELELQTLRKQVVMEKRRGQDLSVELSGLKEEREALTRECEELKGSQGRIVNEDVSKWSQLDEKDLQSMLEEIKEELNHEKNSNAYLRIQLQKTQESNTELILAVRDLDELLEQKNREMTCPKCSVVSIRPSLSSENFRGEESGYEFSHSHISECKQEFFETISEDGEQCALEVLVKGHDGVEVECSLEQKIRDLNSEIELYKKDSVNLEMQMEQLALDYEILKQENHTITSKLEQTQLREQLKMQYDCSEHLTIITDLEAQVINLEKELEEQADSFEADIETITNIKIEQEQRAIRAEEALKKTRWNTVQTAEQLKEDFERLSAQISSTFHMNENLASQALTEADELRSQKCDLEELLEKTNAELSLMQDQFQIKIQELSSLIEFKTKEQDKLLMELKEKSQELVNQKRFEESKQKEFSEDMLVLKDERERLERESDQLSKELERKKILLAEMEQLKSSSKITEMLLQERNSDNEILDRELFSSREESKKLLKELNELNQLKDEKEALIDSLNSEVTTLREEYTELKRSLFEDDLEKENLRKQIFNLRGDLKRREDKITSIEKKLKDSSARFTAANGTAKTAIRNKNNMSSQSTHGSKEVASLHEKVKLLEGNIKLKDEALEDTKNSFLMKEKVLSNRIEELEKNISQSEPVPCEGTLHKENKNIEKDYCKVNANGEILFQPKMRDEACIFDLSGIDSHLNISSTIGSEAKNGEEGLLSSNCDQVNLAEFLSEMEILKEKNESMENELKEMQERYSEISLKFAEVEGERQQLVMTVRNLKNALKN